MVLLRWGNTLVVVARSVLLLQSDHEFVWVLDSLLLVWLLSLLLVRLLLRSILLLN